jgi:hypothetical protein
MPLVAICPGMPFNSSGDPRRRHRRWSVAGIGAKFDWFSQASHIEMISLTVGFTENYTIVAYSHFVKP